jgi:integration host factor subunit alpha
MGKITNKTITKADLIEHLLQKRGLGRVQAKAIVELFTDGIKVSLMKGKTAKVTGLGSFRVRDKKERPGRDLKTRKGVPITARRVVTFRPGPTLKKLIAKSVEDRKNGA